MASIALVDSLPSRAPGSRVPTRADVAFLPLHIVVAALVVVAALAAIALGVHELPGNHDPIAAATGITGLALIAYAHYFLRLPWISAPVVYLMLFWMFHFGMTFTVFLVPSVMARLPGEAVEWFYWPNARLSMILGVLGAAGFVFTVGLLAPRAPAVAGSATVEPTREPALFRFGWLVMLLAIALAAFVLIQNGGAAVLSMTYLQYRVLVLSASWMPVATDLAQIGCLMAVCGAGRRRWVMPVALWTLTMAVPTLLIGGRAPAMIPLVAYAVVLTNLGVRIRRSVLIAAVVASSVVIPAVYAIRQVGFANRDLVNWTQVTPLDTLMELGGSLQSTTAYVDWIAQGDRYLFGASYWASFDRQILVRVIPGRQPIPYEDDERIPTRLMDEREGAVGGSATGEAYYNFGPVGPVIYFGGIGVLFGFVQRLAATPYGSAIMGMLMLPLYFNIRSDWLAVPAQIGQGLLLVAGSCLFGLAFRPQSVPPGPAAAPMDARSQPTPAR